MRRGGQYYVFSVAKTLDPGSGKNLCFSTMNTEVSLAIIVTGVYNIHHELYS